MVAKLKASIERDVVTWNAEVSVGAPVTYRRDNGTTYDTTTREPACVLNGHSAVIWLEGLGSCVLLSRVTVRDAEGG